MSSGGYDAPHLPSGFIRYDPRRASGPILPSYDRPNAPPVPRRSPSPGSSRRSYDSYMPPRSDMSFRPAAPNTYRPNNYRPDYSAGSYYSRSPSPDAYTHHSRTSESDVWDRGQWTAPLPPVEPPNAWSDRRVKPASPSTSSRGRSTLVRNESGRTFEPSETWKQTHVDRPSRLEPSPTIERFPDSRRRLLDRSPPRPPKNDRTPTYAHNNDRFRPNSAKKEIYPPAVRSEYDSYRPQYDTGWTPPARSDPSPSGSHQRRDSGSVTYARSSDRYESPYTNRGMSKKPSISPHPRISPITTPGWSNPENENESWSYRPSAKSDAPLRATSRSSIASTHASDRKSPEVIPVLVPVIIDQQSFAGKVPTGSQIFDQAQSKNKVVAPEPVKEVAKTVHERPVPKSPISTSTVAVEQVAEKPETNKPEPSLPILNSSINTEAQKMTPEQLNEPVSQAQVLPSSVSDTHPRSVLPSGPKPSPPALSTVSPDVPQPHIPENDAKKVSENEKDANTLEQSRPVYPPSPILSQTDAADIDIPPPTHSPILSTPPPIDNAPPSPVVEQPIMPTPEEIPSVSDAKTIRDALRIVVMTRLLCDHQTREERVQPVLAANESISCPPEAHPYASTETLIKKMVEGPAFQDLEKSYEANKPLLVQYVGQRRMMTEEKISRLREEYMDLQERWLVRCNFLNEQQKSLASEHESQHGRTTRRSTAVTDAVRSDFEMEQIIASLGVDEATDPHHLSMRNIATIPDMISVVNGQIDYVFDDTSRLVDNPNEYYAHEPGIKDWTEQEKEIFLDKFAAYPKQFGIIADYLPHKTAAQCVDFYYLHKKQFIDFRRVVSQFAPNKRRRRGMGKKKGNGLLVDIAKHDMEVSRGLESASSPVPTRAPRGRKTVGVKPSIVRRNAVQFEDTPTSTPTPDPEPEIRTRRRRAAANAAASGGGPVSAVASAPSIVATPEPTPTPVPTSAPPSVPPTPTPARSPSPSPAPALVPKPPLPPAPMQAPPPLYPSISAAINNQPQHVYTSYVGQVASPMEIEPRPAKRQKRTRRIKSAAMVADDPPSPGPEGSQDLPANGLDANEAASRRRDKGLITNTWSEEDRKQFLSLLAIHGHDFKRIASEMPNKTMIQVTNYYRANEATYHAVAPGAPKQSSNSAHPDLWKELPYSSSSSANTRKSGTTDSAPMSSLSGDAARNGPPQVSYPAGQILPPRDYGRPPIDRAAMAAYPRYAANPYPTMQPPMAPLGSGGSDPRRSGIYRGYAYAEHPDARGMYYSTKPPENGSGHPAPSPYPHGRAYVSSGYPPMSPPPPPQAGYAPTPPAGTSAPIVHSPTGMASPKPLPMQPMQSYPAQQSDPTRTSYYMPPPVDPRMGTPPHWPHQTSYYGHPRPPVYPPPVPGPNDAAGARENGYPRYANSAAAAGHPYYYPGWTQ